MALIEGVGDEVTILFALVLLLFVLALAWVSTHTAERGQAPWVVLDIFHSESSSSREPSSNTSTNNLECSNTDPNTISREHALNSDSTAGNAGTTASYSELSICNDSSVNSSDPSGSNVSTVHGSDPSGSNVSTVHGSDPSGSNVSTVHGSDPSGSNVSTVHGSDPSGSNVSTVHGSDPSGSNVSTVHGSETSGSKDSSVHGSEPSVSSTATPHNIERPVSTEHAEALHAEDADTIVLRLKFLNDTETHITVRLSDTILHIKRIHFPGREQRVRLIYQGQLLQDDSQTVSSLQLRDSSVLHCHISQHVSVPGAVSAELAQVPLNIGSLLVPLLGLILGMLWYCQLQYPHAFTATATAFLGGVTLLVSAVAFSTYRR